VMPSGRRHDLPAVMAGLDPATQPAMPTQQARRQGVAHPNRPVGGPSGWMAGSSPAMTMESKAIPIER